MANNFERCTEWLLVHEGGYVNHKKDPGGATNRGVTQRVYDGYRRRMGLPQRSVREIETHEVLAIYREQYWDEVRGDALPDGLDYAVYDFAVNSGPGRAVKMLQQVLGVAADGVVGNVTLGAVSELDRPKLEAAVAELCNRRLAWLHTLKTFGTFGRGWTRRVVGEHEGVQDGDVGVIDRAVRMARNDFTPAPTQAAPGKALDEDEGLPSKLEKAATDPATLTKVIGGAITGILGAAGADGPIAYALAACMVVAVVGFTFAFVRKKLRA